MLIDKPMCGLFLLLVAACAHGGDGLERRSSGKASDGGVSTGDTSPPILDGSSRLDATEEKEADGKNVGSDASAGEGSGGTTAAESGSDGAFSRDAPTGETGATACGANTCNAGNYCCNASCGVCAPLGTGCDATPCRTEAGADARSLGEAGVTGDGGPCAALSGLDVLCGGATPRMFQCLDGQRPAPACVLRGGSDVLLYCCP